MAFGRRSVAAGAVLAALLLPVGPAAADPGGVDPDLVKAVTASINAGGGYSCALDGGVAYCWGADDGQRPRNPTLPITGESPLLLVALGTLLVGLGLTFLLVRKSP
ncbi:MAG TPA: LPXTG cell wall anchor domain-containing protein [Actinoplanes sp.]|nr:LPXTG cell wall anchor domain-containing protein [Actinoplanes sp.]